MATAMQEGPTRNIFSFFMVSFGQIKTQTQVFSRPKSSLEEIVVNNVRPCLSKMSDKDGETGKKSIEMRCCLVWQGFSGYKI